MKERKRTTSRLLLASLAVTAVGLIVASGATAAVPQNTASPTITGNAREGQTLTVSQGTWSNTPTAYAYQWQRCTNDGSGCGDITGATSNYVPAR